MGDRRELVSPTADINRGLGLASTDSALLVMDAEEHFEANMPPNKADNIHTIKNAVWTVHEIGRGSGPLRIFGVGEAHATLCFLGLKGIRISGENVGRSFAKNIHLNHFY